MGWFWSCLLLFQTEISNQEPRIDFIETVTVVNLPLKVRGPGGPYRNLKLQDLLLMENGIRIDPQQLLEVETALTLHFLFDLSTSNAKHIFLAKKKARDLVQKMKKDDVGKISYFSTHYQPLTDYTHDRKALLYKLSRLTPLGSTALYDGISGALDELRERSGARVLILFSDGHDLLSHIDEGELMGKVKSYGIPIFFVTFGSKTKKSPLLLAQTQFMQGLVRESGGAILPNRSDYARGLVNALKQQRQRYMVRFVPPGPEDLEQWRSLVVRIENCPDCRVEYRRAYKISALK